MVKTHLLQGPLIHLIYLMVGWNSSSANLDEYLGDPRRWGHRTAFRAELRLGASPREGLCLCRRELQLILSVSKKKNIYMACWADLQFAGCPAVAPRGVQRGVLCCTEPVMTWQVDAVIMLFRHQQHCLLAEIHFARKDGSPLLLYIAVISDSACPKFLLPLVSISSTGGELRLRLTAGAQR